MLRVFLLLAVCLLLSGCTALLPATSVLGSLPGGAPPLQIHEQTTVNLARDNFVVVKTNVFGQSKGFSLLGLLTIYPATLTKAINRMYASAQMRPGEPQTIAQLIVERSSSYWILFGMPKVEAHADIVEFRPAVNTGERVRPKRPPPEPPD